jgi:hypothetical protein
VVEEAVTVTSSPALTLDFTFMTHSPYRVVMSMGR